MEWYALYVHSRAEQKVAERLASKGIEVFCPVETVIRQWSDRRKKIRQPYFRSYVFAKFDFGGRLAILQTPGVVNIVYWLKKPAVIRDREMTAVMDFFKSHSDRDIRAEQVSIGQRRVVEGGVLDERVGIVVKNGRRKIVLDIPELGLLFTVDVTQTRKVGSRSQGNAGFES